MIAKGGGDIANANAVGGGFGGAGAKNGSWKKVPGTILRRIEMRKRIALGVLVLVVFAGVVTAEEITGTIIFEPVQESGGSYVYSIATGENIRIADKRMSMSYGNVGYAVRDLPNYLVKGAKIVYENGGNPGWSIAPMRNTMGETFSANRLIAIIMEDGYYMELTEIVSGSDIAWYFHHLWDKLEREGRIRNGNIVK